MQPVSAPAAGVSLGSSRHLPPVSGDTQTQLTFSQQVWGRGQLLLSRLVFTANGPDLMLELSVTFEPRTSPPPDHPNGRFAPGAGLLLVPSGMGAEPSAMGSPAVEPGTCAGTGG